MIVGTAGHIDHGKTTLVRALTGVDTDRLPEEKQRGISIELGYAFLDARTADARAERIAFIDVPGHERLVHTMIAGATGIDHALLLVAADDGVMPQTREHLAVLSLLGVASGAVVVTKIDRAEPARVAAVRSEAEALLAGTPLAASPLFAVSAHTGEGLADLRGHLAERASMHRSAAAGGAAAPAFRLAIDRVFTLDGVGTVVTGTVFAGTVRVGDELTVCPARGPLAARTLRVRSLHAQNRAVNQASAGERCAVALVGAERDDIERGQWLAAPPIALATGRLDVNLTLWQAEPRALRSGTPVHVHVGAASTLASVAILDGGAGAGSAAGADSLAPGGQGRVQLVLRHPIAAWHGDRVLLRDASASRTLAGGTVLDPLAPTRYRRTPQRLAELEAQTLPGAAARLAALLAGAAQGLDLRRWQQASGLLGRPALPDSTDDGHAGALAQGDWALAAGHAGAAGDAVLRALATYHRQHAEELGPDAARLRRLACPRLPEPLWRALLQRLLATHALAQRGAFVHLPAHGLTLSAVDERIAQKLVPLLAQAGFDGAWARDLARDAGESEPLLRVTLARLAQRGELHQVVRDLVYAPATMARLATLAREVASAHGGTVTAAAYRDATQLGRKRAIQILEYFDRIGMLRRVGDEHRLRSDSTLFTS